MGLELTWKKEDKKRFGNCGKDLDTIVYFRLPESSGFKNGGISDSLERDSHYIVFDKNILPGIWEDLDFPKGESGYAVEYTEMNKKLPKEEIEARFRKYLEKSIPNDIPLKEKETYIQKEIKRYFAGKGFEYGGIVLVEGMIFEDGEATASVYKFIRWVSEKEFKVRAQEARLRQMTGDEEILSMDKHLASLGSNYKEQKKLCKKCPLSTDEDCDKPIHYSEEFLEHISTYGNFPLLEKMVDCDNEFKIKNISQLTNELSKAKEVIESTEISGINLYDEKGNLVEKLTGIYAQASRNVGLGYAVYTDDGHEAIKVVLHRENLFSINPIEAQRIRQEILRSKKFTAQEKLAQIIDIADEIEKRQPTFYFTEIYKERGSFFGITETGQKIELPVVKGRGNVRTNPFAEFRGNTNKIRYTKHPAEESFGKVINQLEKYLHIANRFNIPILIEK